MTNFARDIVSRLEVKLDEGPVWRGSNSSLWGAVPICRDRPFGSLDRHDNATICRTPETGERTIINPDIHRQSPGDLDDAHGREQAHVKYSWMIAGLCMLLARSPLLAAELRVSNAWVRATVAGQNSAAAYMTLKSDEEAELVEVTTDIAGRASIHEMSMRDGMMRMRRLDRVKLSASRPFVLSEGGYHIMLEELRAPLVAGRVVHLTLRFLDARRARHSIDVALPVHAENARGER